MLVPGHLSWIFWCSNHTTRNSPTEIRGTTNDSKEDVCNVFKITELMLGHHGNLRSVEQQPLFNQRSVMCAVTDFPLHYPSGFQIVLPIHMCYHKWKMQVHGTATLSRRFQVYIKHLIFSTRSITSIFTNPNL